MRSAPVTIYLDSVKVQCEAGTSVATVLLANNIYAFSTHPVDQSPRGAFCMMGACQACRVLVDERWQQACQCMVSEGMRVRLSETVKMLPGGDGDRQALSDNSNTRPRTALHSDAVRIDTDRRIDE